MAFFVSSTQRSRDTIFACEETDMRVTRAWRFRPALGRLVNEGGPVADDTRGPVRIERVGARSQVVDAYEMPVAC